jgi:hypothetical protein
MLPVKANEKFKREWRQVLGETDHGLYESNTGIIIAANIKYDSEGNVTEITYHNIGNGEDLEKTHNGLGFKGAESE